MKKLKSRVIKPHIKDCFMKGRPVEFSGIVHSTFWGNYAANPNAKRGCHHLWIAVSCNDPKCTALKAVDSRVLAEA